MGYSARQKKVSGYVEGADRLAKDLKAMGENAIDVLTKAVNAGGDIALDYAKKHCPVKSGALKNSLKKFVNKQTETKAEITIDYDKSLKYGTFVELGTRGKPANPFLRNAIDTNIKEINEVITETVAKGVDTAL